MTTKRFLLIIGIALAAQASTLIPAGAVMTWSFSQVDGVGVNGSNYTVGLYSSLALNAGKPCISYYDSTNGNLMYAWWDGATWQRQTVDSTGDVGLYSSLALDSEYHPRIAYYDSTNGDLKYASWNGTSWTCATVDSTGIVGLYPSLVLDTGNQPHISYFDDTNKDLKYVVFDGANWTIKTIIQNSSSGRFGALALDRNNTPHVSYHSEPSRNLYYATPGKKNNWEKTSLDTSQNVGTYTSLALDNVGNPYIAYYGLSTTTVKVIQYSGSGWMPPSNVETGVIAEPWLSLALNVNQPCLSYCDGNGNLKLALKTDGTWYPETVTNGCIGSSTSLKLIDANTVCISYTTSGILMCVIGQVGSPVRLQQFSARREAGGVRLRWRCSEAADAAGFFLYRAETARGPYVQVNPHLLAADANTFRDWDTSLSGRCYYKLEIVDSAGNRTVYGPERVQ